ncbi:MAG: hypothetical protein H0V39_08320 [Nitrosomonas sp.]|nr:hypothetical protein [Nitrosomonas sp.]
MKLNTNKISLIALLLLLSSITQHSSATHISEPILTEPKTEYHLGETIVLNGWVNYNDQPTADVLLHFKVIRPDGTLATEKFHPSDDDGHFKFEYDTRDQKAGTYEVTITSHCLEIHRHVCTYKKETLPIKVIE